MGVVAILHPQDCLREPPRVRPTRSGPRPPIRRKRSPNTSPPSRAAARSHNNNHNGNRHGPVQGQIRILMRGDALPEMAPLPPAVKASDLGRKSPIPVPTKPQTNPAPFYAGSAFVTSPPPSSLPLPAFFAKKVVDDAVVDPTRALQRLLGLQI